ncbi:hypothetical protein GCM10010478_17680 [Streptomyces erythrogriseus]|uniref:Uncharacterized protein n=1 Tax=Streptomyces erythrogriseus TaxID=284027 RepID=A0ABN3WJU7_9ACTN
MTQRLRTYKSLGALALTAQAPHSTLFTATGALLAGAAVAAVPVTRSLSGADRPAMRAGAGKLPLLSSPG